MSRPAVPPTAPGAASDVVNGYSTMRQCAGGTCSGRILEPAQLNCGFMSQAPQGNSDFRSPLSLCICLGSNRVWRIWQLRIWQTGADDIIITSPGRPPSPFFSGAPQAGRKLPVTRWTTATVPARKHTEQPVHVMSGCRQLSTPSTACSAVLSACSVVLAAQLYTHHR
jgi:hypothetical protein